MGPSRIVVVNTDDDDSRPTRLCESGLRRTAVGARSALAALSLPRGS
ncbi:MAG TPA: hypothetical protein VGM91_11270 [Conexibacter sp.]|jgi:hypothetical protein